MRRGGAKKVRQKARPKAVAAIVSHAGRAKDGSDTEWLLALDADMTSVGRGDAALAIAVAAIRLLTNEISDVPTGSAPRDQHFRQWMLEIAVHKAAMTSDTECHGLPSVSMSYLIEKTDAWGVTMSETTRQLLKRKVPPQRSRFEP